MLVPSVGKESGGLWVAKVLLLSITSVESSYQSQEYAFFQYTEVALPIDIVEAIIWCVYL